MAERADLRTSLRRRPILTTAAAILAIAAALSLTQRFRAATHRYDDIDFATFYGWWTDYSSGGDPWVVIHERVDLRPGLSRPRNCNYTPFFVEVFRPFARLDQKTSFWTWLAVQMLCAVAAVLILARANDPPFGAAWTIIVLSLVMMSRQIAGAIVAGQMMPMILVLLCATWVCARRDRPAAAGLCLALAALLKLFPAAVGGYFLFRRRWRPQGWTIGFFVTGVLLTNPWRWYELATLEMPVAYHLVENAELTVFAFARKAVAHFAGTTIGAEPFFAVAAVTVVIDLALLAIAAAATIASRERDDLDGLLFGLWMALALMMSPLAWIPETLLLLPAYLFGMLAVWDGFQPRDWPRQIALLAGGAILAACISTALLKMVPHPGFEVLMAAYLSAALIIRARIKSDSPREAA